MCLGILVSLIIGLIPICFGEIYGVIIIPIGVGFTTIVSVILRVVVRIIISQSIVVADTLLEMNEKMNKIGSVPAPQVSSAAPESQTPPANTPPAAANRGYTPPAVNRAYTPPAAAAPQAAPAPAPTPASVPAGNAERYFYSGHNADLRVYDTRIVIVGKGYNKSMGEKTIPMKSISAVQFKASTAVNGYITFNVLGEVAPSDGGIHLVNSKQRSSENTVIFKSGRDDAKVKEIKDFIEGIIYGNSAPTPQAAPVYVSVAQNQKAPEEKPFEQNQSEANKNNNQTNTNDNAQNTNHSEQTDNSQKNEKLQLLYNMARNARSSDDMLTAKKYYDMILAEDPLCWEPVFYSVYYTLSGMKNAEIGNKAAEIKNCLNTVLLMVNSINDPNEKMSALFELQNSVSKAAIILQNASVNYYNSLPGITRNPFDKVARTIVIGELLLSAGDGLRSNNLAPNAMATYKQAINMLETESVLSIPTKNTPPQYQNILNRITEVAGFIRQAEPQYCTRREAAARR